MARAISNTWDRLMNWFLEARHATYGLALLRIGLGASTVVILAMYLPNFSYTFGHGSQWGSAMFRDSSVHSYIWPISALFSRADPDPLILAKILVLMAVAVAYTLGWRMRVVSPLFVALWLGFTTLDPVVTNTGHYQTFRLFIIFLLFADTSYRWSLDARRRAKRVGRRGLDPQRLGVGKWRVPQWFPVLSSNVAVVLIGYQLCVIYVTSALWKLQGSTWVTGVASYYPLQVEELTLVPWLNHLAWQVTPAVFIASWLSVYGQLLFPVLLLNRWSRIVGLVLVTGMHASIAILLALPWFSLMMILGDMIFVRDRTWRRLADWLKARFGKSPLHTAQREAAEPEPKQAGLATPAAAGAPPAPELIAN
ncbi:MULTISPECIES: HTTM domain-containing protein [Leucobacter]|uniref:HTTM domain-containing protein n=1 Tax=Leucobacter TaxID=55968 RepID=UPI000E64A834|nr:HTTM domain-containing protein [Leucobacter aridicollis]UTX52572.1 HTTM domain-containing protein [Leucobacter aridicollis]